ncbi:phosphate acetyltransferase [Desulfosarcina sp.]|uniref:phosphate acetyltransferase n=1 Tax=Desulfosarcina sp. TaxID=2027861 RepID=UPI0035697C71
MANSLYIASIEPQSGKSVVALGLMEMLSRRVGRIGYFRPIIPTAQKRDNDIELILQRYHLDQTYYETFAFTHNAVQSLSTGSSSQGILKQIVEKYRQLQQKFRFVLCEGTDYTGVSSAFEFDMNADVASNLGSPILMLVNGSDKDPEEILETIQMGIDAFTHRGCDIAAVIVNRVDKSELDAVRAGIGEGISADIPIGVLPEMPTLGRPTVADIARELGAEVLQGETEALSRSIHDFKVAAMNIPHFLDLIREGDLVITPGDRTDVILSSLATVVSDNYPTIAGLMLTGGFTPEPSVKRLMEGFRLTSQLPIISVPTDTFTSAMNASEVRASLQPGDERKIAAALGLFEANVDLTRLEARIDVVRSTRVTPIMFEYELIERAKSARRHIVLPEGEEPRVLRAAEILIRRDVADITLLGDPKQIRQTAKALGLDWKGLNIIHPPSSTHREALAQLYYDLRREKGLSKEMAWDMTADVSYFGTLMVKAGLVDGMVSGAVHTTGDTIRPVFQIIRTRPGVSIVSSVFLMCLPDRVVVYGDCAVNPNPDASQLADIAISAADTAVMFDIEPRIAMCSYSTGTSGAGRDVDKVREATRIVKSRFPQLKIEGPIQYDAAVDAGVAKTKLPGSEVAGQATVFIFPDLNTGNNIYKAVQRSSGAIPVGPVLQGLNQPVNDLSRGCTAADIVNTVAITVIQAQALTLHNPMQTKAD